MKSIKWVSVFFTLFGAAFLFCGLIFGGIFVSTADGDNSMVFAGIAFGAMFSIPGAIILTLGLRWLTAGSRTRRKGKKYYGKIYGYGKDRSVTVNGTFPTTIRIRYFDESGTEREAVAPTGRMDTNGYPIGATITFWINGSDVDCDMESIAFTKLPGEAELMDNLPLEPEKRKMVSVHCASCGASFQAVAGYSNKCPWCGSYMDIN